MVSLKAFAIEMTYMTHVLIVMGMAILVSSSGFRISSGLMHQSDLSSGGLMLDMEMERNND